MKAPDWFGNNQVVDDGASSADSWRKSWGYDSQGPEVSRATIASSATSSTSPTGTTSTSTVPAQLAPCSIAVRRPQPMDSSISSTQGEWTQWSWKDASASASSTNRIENVTMWGGSSSSSSGTLATSLVGCSNQEVSGCGRQKLPT